MSMNKPMPVPTEISAPFWNALKEGVLRIPHCTACGHWIFYPRRHCDRCFSHAVEWREVSGAGQLYSYTVARIPTLPDFADEMPQKLAVVELDEGVRINTTLVGLNEDEIRIGMRVKPVFDKVRADGATLLRFTAADKDFPARVDSTPEALAAAAEAKVAAEIAATPVRQVRFDDEAAMKSLVSDAFTPWSTQVVVDQALIDEFAKLSGDDYWIHTDPKRAAKQSPFGGTIAHGALVQILQSRLKMPLGFEVTGFNNMVNYGSDRLRFPAPVPAGSRVHARARVKSVEKLAKGMQLTLEVTTHVVGNERPSVINDLVILYM
ncbi:OB-fold domain-containing protein [Aromatoleum toluclasticum]|uniref:bifunctional OB-fold nucleic acid binding domain-containing protein/MaoC family dehydratase n=1 Tax=Aromatoleum toluclasticum TaxID=92003 RepID=UPI001D1899E9|nr:OB-fold domain-containing protein [Aromatoleum toluclasticum]MCC4117577.1 OB-fold domain-containing protein [Aromatoleum toluclasticum]